MKNLITILILVSLLACSKKSDPTPKTSNTITPVNTTSGVNQDSLTILNFPLIKGAYVNQIYDTLFISKVTDTSVFIKYRFIDIPSKINVTDSMKIDLRKATLRKWNDGFIITYPFTRGYIEKTVNDKIITYKIDNHLAINLAVLNNYGK